MNSKSAAWRGHIMTVRGPVHADEMGITLPHEHMLIAHETPMSDLTDPQTARAEMQRFTTYGGSTAIELTCWGMGRNPQGLRAASAWASMNVVMGTGFYKDAWLPDPIRAMSVERMTELMVGEILDGVDDTDIHAGVIGEMGVSRPITPIEERALRAAARAHRETGAAISIHFDIGSQPAEYHYVLDILEAEGADLSRVVLGHFISRPDEVSLCRQMVRRGAYVEFDLFGQEQRPKMPALMQTPPEVQVASLRWFLFAGLLDRMLISQNVCHPNCLRVAGGYGYAHILRDLLPGFREFGVTDQQIRAIMVDNPKRLFPLHD